MSSALQAELWIGVSLVGNADVTIARGQELLALRLDNAEARNGRKRARAGWPARYVTRLLPDVLDALIVLAFRH